MSKKFRDFGIEAKVQSFTGDKIKIAKILNREITILDYLIEPGKFSDKRLRLQLEYLKTKYILFSSSKALMEMIERVKREDFPFETTIIETNEQYLFS